MTSTRMATIAALVLGCASAVEPVEDARGDATLMFVEIEGPLDELRRLRAIAGLVLERGASDAGEGRGRVGVMVRRRSALREVEARGLAVRVVMDEAEARRRIEAERDAIQAAAEDGHPP